MSCQSIFQGKESGWGGGYLRFMTTKQKWTSDIATTQAFQKNIKVVSAEEVVKKARCWVLTLGIKEQCSQGSHNHSPRGTHILPKTEPYSSSLQSILIQNQDHGYNLAASKHLKWGQGNHRSQQGIQFHDLSSTGKGKSNSQVRKLKVPQVLQFHTEHQNTGRARPQTKQEAMQEPSVTKIAQTCAKTPCAGRHCQCRLSTYPSALLHSEKVQANTCCWFTHLICNSTSKHAFKTYRCRPSTYPSAKQCSHLYTITLRHMWATIQAQTKKGTIAKHRC